MQKLKFITYFLLYVLAINISVRIFQRYGADAFLQMVYKGDCESLCWWQRVPVVERIIWSIVDQLE